MFINSSLVKNVIECSHSHDIKLLDITKGGKRRRSSWKNVPGTSDKIQYSLPGNSGALLILYYMCDWKWFEPTWILVYKLRTNYIKPIPISTGALQVQRWLPLRMSKSQPLTIVLLGTPFTQTIKFLWGITCIIIYWWWCWILI